MISNLALRNLSFIVPVYQQEENSCPLGKGHETLLQALRRLVVLFGGNVVYYMLFM